jgi:hypothetical protein
MELLIIAGIFLALAVAALLWGADSVEGIDSREWANRKEWYGKVAN